VTRFDTVFTAEIAVREAKNSARAKGVFTEVTIEFEWDATKAKTNLGKHRISFEKATSAFYDA
jgi:hypothetical protein